MYVAAEHIILLHIISRAYDTFMAKPNLARQIYYILSMRNQWAYKRKWTFEQFFKFLLCVTGFWKTDQIVTLGLFQFIGPPNGYTHTLHIHSAITRVGYLVCFSGASFADPVNSWLRQWDPWRVLYGRHGSEIHPSDSEKSLRPSKHVLSYGWHFLES